MSNRIRGQEVKFLVTVDDQTQRGSFFKVTEWAISPRQDMSEEGFIGEDEDEIDFQHHGFDLSFTVHIKDAKTLRYLSTIVQRERDREAHPDITITVLYSFRGGEDDNVTEVYHNCRLAVNETTAGGRKEYVSSSFEAKAKRRSLVPAA